LPTIQGLTTAKFLRLKGGLPGFYPEKWKTISTQKKWLQLIAAAQHLCYPVYFQRAQNCLSGSREQSVLKALWAMEWGISG